MEKFLNKSGFAAAQGWSPSYVTKLSQQGRLIMCRDNPKLVDVQATLAMLDRTSDPGKAHVAEHHAARRVATHVHDQIRPNSTQAPDTDRRTDGAAEPGYWDNKARREAALASLAELELAKTAGSLVGRAKVEAAAYATGRMLRDSIMGLPTRLAPELAVLTDAFQVEQLLRKELAAVLDGMAKLALDDLTNALTDSTQ